MRWRWDSKVVWICLRLCCLIVNYWNLIYNFLSSCISCYFFLLDSHIILCQNCLNITLHLLMLLFYCSFCFIDAFFLSFLSYNSVMLSNSSYCILYLSLCLTQQLFIRWYLSLLQTLNLTFFRHLLLLLLLLLL